MEEKICCPKFDFTLWDEKEFSWQDKKFIKGKVATFFYMPLNFGKVITKLMAKIESAGATSPEQMVLSDHKSMWQMEMLVAVDKTISGAENITLSGKYLSKVYEGDFSKTGEWMKDFAEFVKSKNAKIKKSYMWYTTCPKCAKKYGKNYIVNLAEIE